MKLIIAGGRNYRFTDENWDALEAIHKPDGFVNGGENPSRGNTKRLSDWMWR